MKKLFLSLLLLLAFTQTSIAAMQSGPPFLWPDIMPSGSTSSQSVINASTDKFGYAFAAPQTGTITGFWFRTGTVTTGATIDVRLETIGTDGNPTGTLVGTTTNNTIAIADTDDNVWKQVTFTAGASVTVGTKYAVVMAVSSGTPVSLGMSFYTTSSNVPLMGLPYYTLYSGSTWTYQTGNAAMMGALNYGGTYPYSPAFFPGVAVSSTTFNSSSTPNVRGLKFSLPFAARACGFSAYYDADSGATIKLYDSNGVTVLTSYDFNTANTPPTTSARTVRVKFSTPVNLLANTYYRLVIAPDDTTNIGMGELTLGNSALYTATGLEGYASYTSATNPTGTGSWTDVTTVLPTLQLVLCGFDDGTGTTTAIPSVHYQ